MVGGHASCGCPPLSLCTLVRTRAPSLGYMLMLSVTVCSSPSMRLVCMYENKLDVATIPTPTVIMSHILFAAHPFACFDNDTDNDLGVDGAKALVPALAQMTHMKTLHLRSKSPMPHAHTAVSSG